MLDDRSVKQISAICLNPVVNVSVSSKNVADISPMLPKENYQITCSLKAIKTTKKKSKTRTRTKTCTKSSPPKNRQNIQKSSVPAKLASHHRFNILHSYLSYSDIIKYLDYIKLRFIDFVAIHTLGVSFEERPIKCIEIDWNTERKSCYQANKIRKRSATNDNLELQKSTSALAKTERNIVFIEGGTHAREWISVTVALNCIYQLTENNVRHKDLLRKLKFYIVPVVNPDGYEYARNVNPRWRKNRQPHTNDEYIGTDCNRNFDFHWDESIPKPKRNTYRGDKPFSEPETKALATILHELAPQLLFFLSLHSYAQTIMYPWGYSKSLPKQSKLMENVAVAGRNAIKALNGRYYRVGSISHITKRNIAGSVVDYAHGAVKVPLTLVMELPSKEYGFQPPLDKIHLLGMESWHGIREMCKQAFNLKAQIDNEETAPLLNPHTEEGPSSLTKDDL